MKMMKRLCCLGITVCMTVVSTPSFFAESGSSSQAHPDLLFADVNMDQLVNVQDVTALQRILAEFRDENVLSVVADNAIIDLNGDGKIGINDVAVLQRFLARFDISGELDTYQIGDPVYRWHEAVYKTTFETIPAKTETVKVVDQEAFDEEVDVIDHVEEEEYRCIYRSGRSNVCNDCGMTLLEDNGKPMSNADTQHHLTLHCGGVLPATTHAPLRYVVDGFGNIIWVRANCSVSIYTGEKDENGKYITEEVFYDESLPLHNYGAYGSYSNNKQTDTIPTGEMETIQVSDFVPVYRSGEAYFCKRCGKIMYFEDGQEYDVRDMARHVMKDCPLYADAPPGTIGVEKRQTDEIPTGQFTDTPKHTHKETINHPEVFHLEERTVEPERTVERQTLVTPAGYQKITG